MSNQNPKIGFGDLPAWIQAFAAIITLGLPVVSSYFTAVIKQVEVNVQAEKASELQKDNIRLKDEIAKISSLPPSQSKPDSSSLVMLDDEIMRVELTSVATDAGSALLAMKIINKSDKDLYLATDSNSDSATRVTDGFGQPLCKSGYSDLYKLEGINSTSYRNSGYGKNPDDYTLISPNNPSLNLSWKSREDYCKKLESGDVIKGRFDFVRLKVGDLGTGQKISTYASFDNVKIP